MPNINFPKFIKEQVHDTSRGAVVACLAYVFETRWEPADGASHYSQCFVQARKTVGHIMQTEITSSKSWQPQKSQSPIKKLISRLWEASFLIVVSHFCRIWESTTTIFGIYHQILAAFRPWKNCALKLSLFCDWSSITSWFLTATIIFLLSTTICLDSFKTILFRVSFWTISSWATLRIFKSW